MTRAEPFTYAPPNVYGMHDLNPTACAYKPHLKRRAHADFFVTKVRR